MSVRVWALKKHSLSYKPHLLTKKICDSLPEASSKCTFLVYNQNKTLIVLIVLISTAVCAHKHRCIVSNLLARFFCIFESSGGMIHSSAGNNAMLA
jgi:hypothetical protein